MILIAELVFRPRWIARGRGVIGMILEQLLGRRKSSSELRSQDARRVPASLSDRGCERERNEDRCVIVESASGTGYFVFDGMGGEPGGDAAAQLSLEAVRGFLQDSELQDATKVIKGAIEKAHSTISLRRQNPAFASMGTTVVGALCQGPEVVIAAVGDSRAYHIHAGGIDQLTSDHTFVQQLVDEGHIVPQDALLHPQSHILTRCVGSHIGFGIDTKRYWLSPAKMDEQSEYLVLCSDGLYSLVTDEEIKAVVMSLSPEDACERLVDLAKQRGGFDNITVLVIPLPGCLKTTPDEAGVRSGRSVQTATVPRSSKQQESEVAKSAKQSWVPFHAVACLFIGLMAMAITVTVFFVLRVWGS